MNHRRLAPGAGVLASLAVLAALGAPYLLVEGSRNVGTYYGSGAVNPLVAGLFAVICVIVFAAGREERTDPGLAAGVTLALGAFGALVALAWALTVRVDVVAIDTAHRWLVTGTAALVPACAAWFARSLGLL